ncbi:MAG: SDR family NAD(P)-dependent oxidoreductase [Dehalococcoidales bacterium]|nr:SDR family NAD(P)-dependent oxidoreductase [Dehalococcoidales bacterium]
MNWQNKKILVTGAGGFIGSTLVEKLVDLGANVKAFVRYNSRNDQGMIELLSREIRNNIEIISGDLRDFETVKESVKNVSIIFHLGALIAIPYSYMHPREYVETNIVGTLNVLSAARDYEVEKIIHTSTSEVYGSARYVPIDENHPLQGQSPYSATKIGADALAESFYRSYNMPVAVIRPFNTFGPKQSARAVIPTIITQALTQNNLSLGSLHPTRDYTYIDDMVQAFVKVAESPNSNGEVINIGSNFEVSIGDIARKVLNILNKNIEIISDEQRIRPEKSEVQRLWCDNSKAKNMIGWAPVISFDEGLSQTIEWISNRMDLYKSEMYNV